MHTRILITRLYNIYRAAASYLKSLAHTGKYENEMYSMSAEITSQ